MIIVMYYQIKSNYIMHFVSCTLDFLYCINNGWYGNTILLEINYTERNPEKQSLSYWFALEHIVLVSQNKLQIQHHMTILQSTDHWVESNNMCFGFDVQVCSS